VRELLKRKIGEVIRRVVREVDVGVLIRGTRLEELVLVDDEMRILRCQEMANVLIMRNKQKGRGDHVIESDAILGNLSDDEKRIQAMELRGKAQQSWDAQVPRVATRGLLRPDQGSLRLP
jgi:hypothetical protein